MNKKDARLIFKQKVETLDKEKREKELIEIIINNQKFLQAEKIGLYYPLKYELNLLVLLEIFPTKRFYFPKTEKHLMTFRFIDNLNKLKKGKFDLFEPQDSNEIEENIEVYLVPCLMTNKNYRLGHGAGYYDRYFNEKKGYKMGIVFNEFKDINFTVENYDVPMDVIL